MERFTFIDVLRIEHIRNIWTTTMRYVQTLRAKHILSRILCMWKLSNLLHFTKSKQTFEFSFTRLLMWYFWIFNVYFVSKYSFIYVSYSSYRIFIVLVLFYIKQFLNSNRVINVYFEFYLMHVFFFSINLEIHLNT